MSCSVQQPLASVGVRPRIRAAMAGCGTNSGAIHAAFNNHGGYKIVAEIDTREELSRVAAEEGPELVIGSAALIEYLDATDQPFPLYIIVGEGAVRSPERIVARFTDPVAPGEIAYALGVATVSVLNAKANELSTLIRSYVMHSDTHVPAITLEAERNGERTEIAADEVLWIKAAGNYVWLHTTSGAYQMRATIRDVVSRLRGAGFKQIHRGRIVNARAIRSHIVHDEVPVAVVLDDGTRLPVGPSYRAPLVGKTSPGSTQ